MKISILSIAYATNIFILIPVVWSLMTSGSTQGVFEGKVENSDGLRVLVGSLYFAILAASVLGLIWPKEFAPLLLVQIIYKATWLCVFIYPLYKLGGASAIPTGISTVFLLIVLTYPILLWLAFFGPTAFRT